MEFNAETRSDPNFPWLEIGEKFNFPDPEYAMNSVVGVGGNLSPGMLLSAYMQGVFPWFNEDDPIYWQSPDPRFIIKPKAFRIPKRLERSLKKHPFEIKVDKKFEEVITRCAYIIRDGQWNTWITEDMQEAYLRLYENGYAHSIESYLDGELVGGFYGVSIGPVFFGESMFTSVSNASKIAFVVFAKHFFSKMNGVLIDSQVYTDHMARFGGANVSRDVYLRTIREVFKNIKYDDLGKQENWENLKLS